MSKTKILIFFLIGLFTLTQCTSKKNVKQSVNKAIKKEEVKKEVEPAKEAPKKEAPKKD